MTLTDFLLARIAEDEEQATGLDEPHYSDCLSLDEVPFPCSCGLPARVLAECEAKRRIVALTARVSDLHDFWDGEQGQPDTELDPGDQILEALALPYADHPDYREEWRP